MALPSSGQITLAQIRDEFASGTTSNVSLRTLSANAGLSVPDQFSDFYGLSAYTAPSYSSTSGTTASVTGSGTQSSPFVITLGTLTGAEDYSIYDFSSCCGCYYILKYFSATMRFTSNFAGPQKSVIDITAGGWYGPSTSATCTGFGDFATYYRTNNDLAYASSNGTALTQLRNAAATTSSSTFTTAVNGNIDITFYGENVVDQSGGDWGASGVVFRIYFIPG